MNFSVEQAYGAGIEGFRNEREMNKISLAKMAEYFDKKIQRKCFQMKRWNVVHCFQSGF